ncbi:hypothetical protein [Streptomyces sp. NPDC024089]|uniref:hypothetical protein n=1 Tax=Streptomyces sp. NPDC024089 TaxID=3154328 RepID=UPI0033F7C7ED
MHQIRVQLGDGFVIEDGELRRSAVRLASTAQGVVLGEEGPITGRRRPADASEVRLKARFPVRYGLG